MASGIINGLCRGKAGSSYRFWVEWQSTPIPAENASVFSATAYLQRSDGNKNSAYNLYLSKENKYISLDGEKFLSLQDGIDTRNLQQVVIAQVKNKKIYHLEDGSKQILIESGVKNINATSISDCSLSGYVTLDRLNPYAPYFTIQPKAINISQTTAKLHFYYENADVAEYSIDGQKNWTTYGEVIENLDPFKNYTVFVRISNSENGLYSISEPVSFRTLPIYIESVQFLDPFILANEGEWTEIKYSITPENASIKNLEFSSNNTQIAYTSGNNVYGAKVGFTTISAKTIDGSGIEYTLSVTVPVRVTGIKSEYPSLTIQSGKTAYPLFVVSPSNAFNKGYSLQSSDENIVKVDGIDLIAVNEGTAIVTATTFDGLYTDNCIITVVHGYTWYDFTSPPDFLNTEDIEHIFENIKTIRYLLANTGLALDDLIDVSPQKSTPISQILEILQNIEYNLDRISENEYKSVYYIAPVDVGFNGSNYQDIFRWINILNDMYNMLMGYLGRWGYVLLNDGFPLIEGKRIVIRRNVSG